MVGRPYPKYKPYEPGEDSEEKKKKKKDDEPEDPDEAIARERRVLERGRQIRSIDKEIKELEQPRRTAAKERLSTAKSGILGFASEIAKEGVRATRKRSIRKGGQRVRRSMAYPQVYHPVSTDISLSKAIAMNNWSGESTGLMERDFFGVDNQGKELLGDRNREINIGGNFQQDFFGNKKDIELIGSTNKIDVDSLIGNNKKGKKKEIRYI